MPRVYALTEDMLRHVVTNMREADKREIYATRGSRDPEHLIYSLVVLHEFAWVICADDGEPAAVIGAMALWPGVAAMWAFGTDRWPEVVLSVTKHAIRFMVPKLLELGFHRGEARALASRNDVARWLGLLGFKKEAVLSGFGSGREDFALYAWTADEKPT